MIDAWMLWVLLVGLAVGLFAAWLLLVRLPRDEADVTTPERRHEAAWISRTIEYHGGIAPETLVEEVLDLHAAYLRDPSLRPGATEHDELPPPMPPSTPPYQAAPAPGPATYPAPPATTGPTNAPPRSAPPPQGPPGPPLRPPPQGPSGQPPTPR